MKIEFGSEIFYLLKEKRKANDLNEGLSIRLIYLFMVSQLILNKLKKIKFHEKNRK